MLVLEDYEHAKARGARIHAELVGYGVTSDGADMVAPIGEGACAACAWRWRDGRRRRRPIDYLNTHGTSTPLGDIVELEAVRAAFGDAAAAVVDQGADGPFAGRGQRARGDLQPADAARRLHGRLRPTSTNWIRAPKVSRSCAKSREAQLRTVMSNSFGFGGTNATLVFRAM
jgi:3-oxoacyl-[acyl-carrier-protein] synthase-1